MKLKQKKLLNNKLIIFVTVLILIIGVAVFFLIYHNLTNSNVSNNSSNSNSSSSDTTNDGSKTDEEKKQDSSTVNKTSNVILVIVDASQYNNVFEIRAYAADVVSNGTCEYIFTSGDYSVSKKSTATAGASTTSCSTIDIPISELSESNSWDLTIKYTSSSNEYYGKITQSISLE